MRHSSRAGRWVTLHDLIYHRRYKFLSNHKRVKTVGAQGLREVERRSKQKSQGYVEDVREDW